MCVKNKRLQRDFPLISGYEKLQKCDTENSAKALQEAVVMSPNKHLSVEIAGCDWQTILARELYYHCTCYIDLTRKRNSKDTNCSEQAFQDVKQFITEKVLENYEVLRLADLAQLYVESKSKYSKDDCQLSSSTAQKLKKRIQKAIGEDVGFWRPNYESEYFFNNKIEKGHLIEVAVRSKITKTEWEGKSVKEKASEIANEVRRELLETPSTFSRYVMVSLVNYV